MSQADKADALRKMITGEDIFVLPEVWDVASARILADAGFSALGSSATALAWSLGYRAKERIKLDDLLLMAARIARGTKLPVTADLEGGLDRTVAEIDRATRAAVISGCAGVSLGDGGRDGGHGLLAKEDMAERIAAIRKVAEETKIPLVITARTEVFLTDPAGVSPFEAVRGRAEAYFAAGADCLLVPGVQHLTMAEKLANAIPGPLGIAVTLSTAPDLATYQKAGVACVTLGSSLMRSLLGNLRLKAEELLAFGHFSHLDKAIPVEELEDLLR